jgi:hypothetical protein
MAAHRGRQQSSCRRVSTGTGWRQESASKRAALITTVPGVFREADFLDRVRLDKECERWSHEIVRQASYRTGLSVFRTTGDADHMMTGIGEPR